VAVAAALVPAAERAGALLADAVAAAREVEAVVIAADRAVEQAEGAAGASASVAHAAEVEAAVAAERAAEAGPPPPEGEELDPERAAAELAELERRRESIGAVNPLAAAERDELGEREAEMVEQIADLEAAAASLGTHLAELDAAVAEGFDSLFDAFRDRFTEVCGLLFPGGEGRLRAVWWPWPSASRSPWPGRRPSTCSTRSRPPSTTSTCAASSPW
jgi:chromosome segregation protein